MKPYEILSEDQIYKLETSIIRYLENGYSLVGGPFINQYDEFSSRYGNEIKTTKREFCQAVYKKSDGTEEDY